MKKYVAYYRVSTARQGESGLGLEAQQIAVKKFINNDILIAEYIEIESGKKNNRIKLVEAISEAKNTNSTLIIAKLDRLSRNAVFLLNLLDTGVDFIAVDNPHANSLTIGIFAVIAQHESKQISQRTKDALAAKKLRGESMGTPANLTVDARLIGLEVRQENARSAKNNVQAADIIADKQALGWKLQKIANHLNAKGYKTRRGCDFTPCAVQRLAPASAVA